MDWGRIPHRYPLKAFSIAGAIFLFTALTLFYFYPYANISLSQCHRFTCTFIRNYLRGQGGYVSLCMFICLSVYNSFTYNHLSDLRENFTGDVQGAPIKNNPLEKILYLRNCSRFFHQIYAVYRGGFRPCIQQIAFKYLV